MRRFLLLAAIILTACHSDKILDPVQTVDGVWSGEGNGVSLSLTMTQTDTLVTGITGVSTVAGSSPGTASGTFKYPNLHLILTFDAFQPIELNATMSATQAKLDVVLNGSGLTNKTLSIIKR